MRPWKRLVVSLFHLLSFYLIVQVSGLLDGGDFVILNEGTKDLERHKSSLGFCPKPTFDQIFLSRNNVCPVEDEPDEQVNDNNDIEVKLIDSAVIIDKTIDSSKDDSEEEIKEPQPPLIVKAIPVKLPNDDSVSNKEVQTQTEKEIEDKKESSDVELSKETEENSHFDRKESAVDEEPIVEEEPPSEDVIAPFSQWAEKKLEEQAALKDATKKDVEPDIDIIGQTVTKPATKSHVSKTNGVHKMNKNFASPDCSAKIVGANPGSQGSGNVISTSRDEYFLNKCSDKAWFVVELCESIKAVKVQIANFELYSSSPNEFKVYVGNVFPAREKDWIEFGTFSYEDERSVQTFKNDVGVVGKYAKVEIVSHHGSEHYCPVSLFKVFGIPEIDLISEEDDPEDPEDSTPEETGEDEPKHHPIVQTIKDAVHKVVNVFRPQNVSLVETLNTSSLQGASLRFRLRPEAGDKYDQDVINRYHMIYYLLATQYSKIKQYSQILHMNQAFPCICEQYGLKFQDETLCNTSQSHPWQFIKFVRGYHGEDFMVALCNLESMESGQSRLVERGSIPGLMSPSPTNKTLIHQKTENGTKVNSAETVNVLKETDSQNNQNNTNNAKINEEPTLVGIKEVIPDIVPEQEVGNGVSKEEPTKAPAVEVTKPPNSANNHIQAAAQTTWQKLSNRIKALERNVTLSTGFLEELSLKYIKQIEELNSAVKIANDAIAGILKREEISRDRTDKLTAQVDKLTKSVKSLEGNLVVLQDEILARHGLLILGEVLFIGLVFLLCRPETINKANRLNSVTVQDNRRRSLDTMKDMRDNKRSTSSEKRRSSIEVACLGNGQLGSLVQNVEVSGLTRKQKKRKRRKDSKQMQHGLRHVTEELESDYSNPQDIPYSISGRHGMKMSHSDDVFEYEYAHNKTPSPIFKAPPSVPAMQSTPCKTDIFPDYYQECDKDTNHNNGWRHKDVKTVRFPSIPVSNVRKSGQSHTYNNHPEITNIYTMLENSVHDVESSACDTETEDKRGQSRLNSKAVKIIRSKSSSPSRQVFHRKF